MNDEKTPFPASDNIDGEARVSVGLCRILIIDDNQRSQLLIGSILTAAGMTNQEFAGDGVEGLSKVESFQPDIIILDIMMPKMDGLEFLKRLRADPNHGTTPVLVQTALGTPEDRNRVYKAGATDMLTKPISGGELIIRVRTHLENRLLVQNHQDRLRLESEINAARQMQEALLPPSALLEEIQEQYAIDIDAHFETSSELGGDFWGVHRLQDHQLGIYIVDFSGHGVGAALNTFRLHTLMSDLRPSADDPAAYLATLNNQLVQLLAVGQFATMFYGIIDTKLHSLTYSAAAAPPPLVGQEDAPDLEFHDTRGLPLGMKKDTAYENHTTGFPPGCLLFLYSDALIETTVTGGEDLDEAGVKALLRESLEAEGTNRPLEYMIGKFHQMMAEPLRDDLTAVLVRRERKR